MISVDYPAYEARLREHAQAIRTAETFVDVVWLYMDAMRLLAPGQEGKAYPSCWVGSGMRREMAFLFARTPLIHCVAPLRTFDAYYASFAKARFHTTEVRDDVLKQPVVKVQLHSTRATSRLPALLLGRILPVFSFAAPRQTGASRVSVQR